MASEEVIEAEVARRTQQRQMERSYEDVLATRGGKFPSGGLEIGRNPDSRRWFISVDDGRATLQFTAQEALDILNFLDSQREVIEAAMAELAAELGDAERLKRQQLHDQVQQELDH